MPDSRRSNQKRSGLNQSRVRVIAGKWRGRWIDFPNAEGLRPTGDRMRETLFNWLQPELSGARCVDLFAGSGALGIEAVSRGATCAILNDSNPEVANHLRQQVEKLGSESFRVHCADALSLIGEIAHSEERKSVDLAFVDPPFAAATQISVLEELGQSRILSGQATVYVEAPAAVEIESRMPPGFQVHRSRTQAQVQCLLLRWTDSA